MEGKIQNQIDFFFRWVKDTTISWPVHAKVQIKNQVVAINTTSETAIC